MDVLPESQQQQQMVQQMLGVFEALMGYTMSSWTLDTSTEKAQKLNSLFKGYTRVTEFAKVIHRVLKYGCQVLGHVVLPYRLRNFLVNICPKTMTYHDVGNVFVLLAARITPLYSLKKINMPRVNVCLSFCCICCDLSVESVYTLLQYLRILEVFALLMKLQIVNSNAILNFSCIDHTHHTQMRSTNRNN